MASTVGRQPCAKCDKGFGITMCGGCQQWFCTKHFIEHRHELATQMDSVGQEHDLLQRDFNQENIAHPLLSRINDWEQKSIEKIKIAAEVARTDLRERLDHIKDQINKSLSQMKDNFQSSLQTDDYTEIELKNWIEQLKEVRMMLEKPVSIEILDNNQTEQSIRLIQLQYNQPNNKQPLANQLLVDDAINGNNSVALLSQEKMNALKLQRGDTIFIRGNNNRQTICVAYIDESCPIDRIRINPVVRNNVQVNLSDFVSIQTCRDIKYGKQILISLIQDHSRTTEHDHFYDRYIRPYFLKTYRPVREGDKFLVRADTDVIAFQVIKTDPSPYCIVAPDTDIKIYQA